MGLQKLCLVFTIVFIESNKINLKRRKNENNKEFENEQRVDGGRMESHEGNRLTTSATDRTWTGSTRNPVPVGRNSAVFSWTSSLTSAACITV